MRFRPHRFANMVCILLLAVTGIAETPDNASRAEMAADKVLSNLHAAMPRGPIALDAELRTQTRGGEKIATYNIELIYAHTNDAFAVEMTLYDNFGGLLERIALKDIGTSDPVYKYWQGAELEPADMPALSESIGATDFRWTDLTLSFLWWTGGKLTGSDSMKGRQCYIVELPAPADTAAAARAELWIDSEMFALLRAKFYDAEGDLIKRFDVKSFAKTGDLWMVKDVDMRSYPSRRRTTLRVRNVDDRTDNQLNEEERP